MSDGSTPPAQAAADGFVHVRGARVHNLKNVDVRIPRGALVVFTGVSGSGKSSLAFGTLYAEAQRRYLESVAPYARRLFHQVAVPEVDAIEGLPPAVALQQQRGAPTTRSSVGSVTTLSNLLRMLYSRAGDYPRGQDILYAESFSPNTVEGACPRCHGLGRIYDVTERSMVPDDSLTIRERAIASWPPAWHGQNLRDILVTLGYDVDRPWRELPKKDRDWILYTEETPTVPVYAGYTPAETRRALKRKEEPSYMGTFTGARKYVLETFAKTESAQMKKRVSRYMVSTECPECHGKRLRPEALRVKFEGLDIADMSRQPLKRLAEIFRPWADGTGPRWKKLEKEHPEKALVACRIARDLEQRLAVLMDLGLGYLSLERSTPTLSPGELQRLRIGTQVHSNLFGVVYVLDEPSAGLHPADTVSLLRALDRLKAAGNSIFVIEHELDVMRHADWIVDVGPDAGQHGGRVLYSGPVEGLKEVKESRTRAYLFGEMRPPRREPRQPKGWLRLEGVTRNNVRDLDVAFPLGVFTTVTGVSGSGKSSLVSQALVELVQRHLGHEVESRGGRGAGAGAGAGGGDGRADRRGDGGDPAAGGGGPEADRADAAVQPGDLYGLVRRRPQALRCDEGRSVPEVRRGEVLVQRGQGAVRDVRGRGVRDGRAALPAERVRAVPDVSRVAVQRSDARGAVPGEEHRRGVGDDGGRGVGVLRGGGVGAAVAGDAAERGGGVSAAGAAGDGALRG